MKPANAIDVARIGSATGSEPPALRVVSEWRLNETDAVAAELTRTLAERDLAFVFQPIVHIGGASVFGFEALMRPPAHSCLSRPDTLLAAARQHGRLIEAEEIAALGAVQAFGALGLSGKLFLNLSAPTLNAFAADRGTRLLRALVDAGIAPSRLMLELTEHERVDDPDELSNAFAVFANQGVGLALDDFGDGRSSLRLWAQLKPGIVKIDKYFVRGIHVDSRKVDVLRAILGLAERFGALVVAEGVEEAAELAVLRDLGCGYVQGYLLGRPVRVPDSAIAIEALEVLASSKIAVLPNSPPRPDIAHTVARLMVQAPTVRSVTTNDGVRRLFASHPDLHAVAVLDGDYPVGLINRRSFIDQYAQPFYHELHGRRSCETSMNPAPFRVEASVPIDSMVRMLAGEDQRYLFEGFIVTEAGRYAGLATGESLVRAVTERRIEAARHANPLTLLPGNIPITEHIGRLIQSSVRFAACYFDLNNFKPFNDLYGYWRGDEMIKLAANVLLANCDPAEDFVGHVGGDDFVVLFQSDDWEARARRCVAEFNTRAHALFDADDLAQGGFQSEDRQGFKVVFPLTTIAVGAVWVTPGVFTSPEDVATAAATAKKLAKQVPGGFHLAGSQGVA
ncbi:MAG: EAL domain-containing protein [Rhodocyclaceae bacterium]